MRRLIGIRSALQELGVFSVEEAGIHHSLVPARVREYLRDPFLGSR